MQKGTFYKPVCNLLIYWRLQRQFLMIMSWFANNSKVQFVRVFQTASPRPSPKGEGGQLARFSVVFERKEWGKKQPKTRLEQPLPVPLRRERENKERDSPLCLKRHNWVFESFSRLTSRLKSKRVTCYKLRIYELRDRRIAGLKLRIYELQIGELQAKNHKFTNWEIGELRAIA